jgi:hypothetical protein
VTGKSRSTGDPRMSVLTRASDTEGGILPGTRASGTHPPARGARLIEASERAGAAGAARLISRSSRSSWPSFARAASSSAGRKRDRALRYEPKIADLLAVAKYPQPPRPNSERCRTIATRVDSSGGALFSWGGSTLDPRRCILSAAIAPTAASTGASTAPIRRWSAGIPRSCCPRV